MYDDEGNKIDDAKVSLVKQIETTAKLQHLTGQRREAFTDSLSLCNTCKWAQSRRRATRNTREMSCSIFSGPCPEDINECSEYGTVTSMTLSQMAGIAILVGGSSDKKVGFQGGET